uniref:DUF6754 domain-containing protein n=1 Tax=candidate division WOR-3 bacterium TaxID=2052148 RepID=A0A7C4TC41_UNCW3
MFLLLMIVGQIELRVCDTPNDDGSSITVEWNAGPGYRIFEILRSTEPDGDFEKVYEAGAGETIFIDSDVKLGKNYFYKIVGRNDSFVTNSQVAGPVRPEVQYFNLARLPVLVCIIVLFAIIILYITRAKSGEKLFVRKIPALKAIEEAIGRATEMGKPVLYVPGIMDIDDPQTIASMSILSRVAEKTAEYGTSLYVPTSKSMAMTMAQQIVKESATRVGRPDWYNPDNIRYITDDQFAYVSAVDGIMLRERPATNFYLGTFYAESLILAETGHSTGAIQIAGTAMPDQLPFFVAACDFTLLGEELYAASAYLSQEPVQLGSLKGQDLGKLLFISVIVIGVLSQIFNWHFFINLFNIE